MTIEEMKKNLNRGITEAELLKYFQNNLKEAKKQIAAERVKADTVANARKQLAQSICSYAKALYDVDADVAEITVMLKDFENETKNQMMILSKLLYPSFHNELYIKIRAIPRFEEWLLSFVSLFSFKVRKDWFSPPPTDNSYNIYRQFI